MGKQHAHTKIQVYEDFVLSTLLYDSESWTLYAHQESRFNTLHLLCLRRLLGISCQDRITDIDVLAMARLPNMFSILITRRMRWLGHVIRMDDGHIPKDLLFL